MKYAWTLFYLLLLISFATFNISSSAGAANRICASCHFGATDVDSGSLFMVNVPSGYTHNTIYPLELCVVDTDMLAAGFRLEASTGALSIPSGELNAQIMSGEATHNKRTLLVNDTACWKVNWTAPLSGNEEALFTYRANAVNYDFTNQGDHGGYFMQESGGVLPVSLNSFKAVQKNNTVLIKWSTVQEIKNDYFQLWKSIDRETWSLESTHDGQGFSNEWYEYHHTDFNPFPGKSFYKLVQTDTDGTSVEIDQIDVYFESSTPLKTFWQSGERFTLQGQSTIGLYTISGSRIAYTRNGSIQLPVVPSGIYLVTTPMKTFKIWIE